ncbi:MAG: nucleotide exchange factor GrpE [Zoogloeaceae bacterium]|jgi:molecular chaperone GrpE|nr:nucleotide exchange factor GrpE [Zoogloeaceae bacterium]
MNEHFEPTQEVPQPASPAGAQTDSPAKAAGNKARDEEIPFVTVGAPGAGETANITADLSALDANAALNEEIARLRQQLTEREDAWLRARAEAENARRRAQEDLAKASKFAIEKFAGELLAVKDSLEAALASEKQSAADLRSGVELTLKQLVTAFEKAALKEINPVGEKFDPNLHQAIQVAPSDLAPDTVAQVLQKGYLIAERVLRPAMVLVSKGPADGKPASGQ